MTTVTSRSFHDIRQALLSHQEVALIDLREEDPFAQEHPLFAANIPLSKLELEIYARVPRRDTAITLYDDGEGLTAQAGKRLLALGYSDVAVLDGGLAGWRSAGGELFRDVNAEQGVWRAGGKRAAYPIAGRRRSTGAARCQG